MPGIYDEEEAKKLKRVKNDRLQPSALGEGIPTAVHRPVPAGAGVTQAIPGGEYMRAGMQEAAAAPTAAGRFGKAARTMITAPVVAGYEMMREPVSKTAEAVGAAGEFTRGVSRELFRTGQPEPSEISTPTTPPPETQDTSRPATLLRAGPTPAEQEVSTATEQETPGAQARQVQPVQYGGLMRPVQGEEPPAQITRPPERLSDIAMPESIGDITRYKLERGAKKFDIEQAQAQKEAEARRTAAQEAGVDTGEIAKKELELKQEAQKQRAGKEGRAEAATRKQQAQLEAAQREYEEAETIEAKTAAAQRVNMLSGRGVAVPKAPADKTMSQKEASDAQQSAQREYTERTGTTEGFFEEFFQTNPVAFKANYGNLAPADVNQYNQIVNMSDSDLAKRAQATGMSPDEFRSEAYRRYKEAGGK